MSRGDKGGFQLSSIKKNLYFDFFCFLNKKKSNAQFHWSYHRFSVNTEAAYVTWRYWRSALVPPEHTPPTPVMPD